MWNRLWRCNRIRGGVTIRITKEEGALINLSTWPPVWTLGRGPGPGIKWEASRFIPGSAAGARDQMGGLPCEAWAGGRGRGPGIKWEVSRLNLGSGVGAQAAGSNGRPSEWGLGSGGRGPGAHHIQDTRATKTFAFAHARARAHTHETYKT